MGLCRRRRRGLRESAWITASSPRSPRRPPFFGLVPWPPPPIRRHAQSKVRGGLNLAIAATGKRDLACDSCVSGLPQTSWPWRGATQGDRERGFLRTVIVHRTSGEEVEEDPFTLQGRAGVGHKQRRRLPDP